MEFFKPKQPTKRMRVRDIGLSIGRFRTGDLNAITDVRGVKVGHVTLIQGSGELKPGMGPVRTGVTAIIPSKDDVYQNQIFGGGFILNGAGEFSGLTQVMEWGTIETPILLTNTFSVGTCSEAMVKSYVRKYPRIGIEDEVIIPLVGECDDSWLNDISGRHVKSQHVYEALEKASSGIVEEGCVGGGTGMITCDFAGGIGTSSRKLPQKMGGYTIGVLVMSNFGNIRDLRFGGIPIGELLEKRYQSLEKRQELYGSIISVVSTDAPLTPGQLSKLATRSALGIGRVGSYAANGSGEIIIAFSNANKLSRRSRNMVNTFQSLDDPRLDPLYEAVVDSTEEAILNALCMATDMTGINNHYVPAIPLDKVKFFISKYKNLFRKLELK
ncbi:peptidase S58 [candidate division CPR3 bacterium GWF2_35_18]|nr:MAG: peptidase S58 [candidate division CPR3 bacterium GWF2_35_18]OGB65028.1 MAG: peptidase S58 [candidate division CPR3 bacterium RIFOXYA2_FULL_35_13]OGB78601.1 MAG: peptidase S58 [candidate division CPR3 bacterium RIFOXYB2_FULL_35_8]